MGNCAGCVVISCYPLVLSVCEVCTDVDDERIVVDTILHVAVIATTTEG